MVQWKVNVWQLANVPMCQCANETISQLFNGLIVLHLRFIYCMG